MRALVGGLIAAVVLLGAAALAIGVRAGGGGLKAAVSLTVTHEFGAQKISHDSDAGATAGDTVMRLLEQHEDVTTRYGGGFVQSINGIAGGREGGKPVDWFYYVNGIESPIGAAQRKVVAGDSIWWDRHVWQAAQHIPAVVGAFPQPFLSGTGGRRIPVKIVCQPGVQRSCTEVETRLAAAHVNGVALSTVELGPGEQVLRVIVGPWAEVRRDPVARTLEQGPAASGVYARPAPDGRTIGLLDELGRQVRTIGIGGGLVAATSQQGQEPTWLVTGTDQVGVDAAVAALQTDRLDNHFAVAVESGHDIALPTAEPGQAPGP